MFARIAAKECFLFDLDGTLVDSNQLHCEAFHEVLNKSAPQVLSRFDYEAIKGRSTRDVFSGLGFSDGNQVALMTQEKQRAFSVAVSQYGVPLMPGAPQILHLLHAMRRKLYIVSAGSRTSTEVTLRAAGIRRYFSAVVTSDDVTRNKPDPEIYRKCVEVHGLVTTDCVAIEDSESGLAASTAAGIDSILINGRALGGTTRVFPTLLHLYDALSSTFANQRGL